MDLDTAISYAAAAAFGSFAAILSWVWRARLSDEPAPHATSEPLSPPGASGAKKSGAHPVEEDAGTPMELIGGMSGGMAHDLNDLLTPLKTLVQLVEEDAGARKRFGDLLPIANRSIDALQGYVEEALFFSRHRRPRIRPTRLDEVLQRVVYLAEPRSRQKGVRVRPLHTAAHTVEVDDILVQRMVSNILANAIDASESGSQVEIEIQTLHKEAGRPPWVRIRILDWGAGIGEEHIQRLLSGKVASQPATETRGSGLGFSIALKIAQLHGGQISVFSEETVGTCVEIDLPGSPAAGPGANPEAIQAETVSATQKVYR